MHEFRDAVLSWAFWLSGVALLWFQDHGLGVLGLVGVLLNMYLQLRKARRDDREGDARYEREGRESRARIDALERQTAAIESNAAAAHARIAPAKAEAEADVSRRFATLREQNDEQREIDRATRGGG